jgi:hypothetical protein
MIIPAICYSLCRAEVRFPFRHPRPAIVVLRRETLQSLVHAGLDDTERLEQAVETLPDSFPARESIRRMCTLREGDAACGSS